MRVKVLNGTFTVDQAGQIPLQVVEFGIDEQLAALALARKHGVRGGAVYDFMHRVAARKAGATILYTLNMDDFQGLARTGAPMIQCP